MAPASTSLASGSVVVALTSERIAVTFNGGHGNNFTQGDAVRMQMVFDEDPDFIEVRTAYEDDIEARYDVYAYPSGSDIVRSSEGVFYIDLLTAISAGVWNIHIQANGDQDYGENLQIVVT